MSRTTNRLCPTCTALNGIHRSPVLSHFRDLRDINNPAIRPIEYVGLPMQKVMLEPTHRLYTRTGGVNNPIGYICGYGHIELDTPVSIPTHFVTPTSPPSIICTHTGETIDPFNYNNAEAHHT